MNDLDLAARLKEIATELTAISEIPQPTHADNLRWTELTSEFEQLHRSSELTRIQRALDSGGTEGGSGPDSLRRDAPNINVLGSDPHRAAGRLSRRVEAAPLARSAVERYDGPTTDAARERLTRAVEGLDARDLSAELTARLITATSSAAYGRAFEEHLRGDGVFTSEEAGVFREVRHLQRALSLTDADGGVLVPSPLDPSVMLDDDGTQNELRRLARKVTATSSTWTGVTSDAVVASYDAEAEEVSDDSSSFAKVEIPVRAMRVFLPFSWELESDSAGNFLGQLVTLMADAKDGLEATSFLNGSGVAPNPAGLITGLNGTASDIPTATASTLAAADITGLYTGLAPRFRPRSTWLADAAIWAKIGDLQAETGVDLADARDTLYRRPTSVHSSMDATVTTGSEVLVLGDFQQFIIADRLAGMTVSRVQHLVGPTRRYPTGESGLFGWVRHGSKVAIPRAFGMLTVA